MRTHGGVVHHIHEHGIAPALAGGRLFVTDLMGADGGGVTFAVRVDDLAAVRLPGRGNVAPSTTSLRRAVVTWHSGEDTVVRKTSVR